MADGRKKNGGARNGAGSPGYGKLEFIKNNVLKFSKDWWTQWEQMMNGKDKDLKKVAFSEFNKLQIKMIPTKLEDDDGNAVSPVLVTFLNKDEKSNNNRNT